jgi:diacylglycerol kinase (ATP)
MTTVAVVAHSGKVLGGGLPELRAELTRAGHPDVLWYEVPKSRKAPAAAKRALKDGADLVFVWGGDGTIQRVVDSVAGAGATLALLPAGTANLLARNLGIPIDLSGAVEVGLHGDRRALDTGTVNGEHFAVMSGVGLDAFMIKAADSGLKDKVGRVAYVWTGAKALSRGRTKATVRVDGSVWFKGKTSCVLVGNIQQVLGGITFFDAAEPDDGVLDVGVITAKGSVEWARTLSRVAVGKAAKSPFIQVSTGKKISVELSSATPYELDGGDRPKTKKLRFVVHPSSITVCVPPTSEEPSP